MSNPVAPLYSRTPHHVAKVNCRISFFYHCLILKLSFSYQMRLIRYHLLLTVNSNGINVHSMADTNGTDHLHLSPPQAEILASGLLSSGFNCVLQMPTGSGKTWLAENAIRTTLEQGGRAVYLTPLRALAAELVEKWQQQFAPFKVGVFTGDYGINNRP